MNLQQQLWEVWEKYRGDFGSYLECAGLDLRTATKDNLLKLLARKVKINRDLPGLEEFCMEGCRGIEPGDPAKSLFYHVFASPHVRPEQGADAVYPRMEDLEVIENCVYGVEPPSLDQLFKRASGGPLAVAVFAYEYAPAVDTVHRHHADLCFSRTGISRVGNAPPHYFGESRGFFPHSGELKKVHVVPARFGAFIAVQEDGNNSTIGPMRFSAGDEKRKFWVPIHKLFSGSECIKGLKLDLTIHAHHLNEKIRRVHLALQSEYHDTGWSPSQMKDPPFRITEGLAEFSAKDGLVIPIPHDPLVEPARTLDGKLVGFNVPPKHKLLAASLWLSDLLDAMPRPEFVHIKHAIRKDSEGRQKIVYLPDIEETDISQIAERGNYEAANFVDYTADGWVKADCPALTAKIPLNLTAYSILAQPDFFPLVRQQDLIEWWEKCAPEEIKDNIWSDSDTRPIPLSGSRLPANITFLDGGFDSTETAMTAIVGMDRKPGRPGKIIKDLVRRESTLSYRATNLFEPGWDSSQDFNRDAKSKQGTFHLASYGLGSPYPEDSLICAALGSFWPGAVPDATRFFALADYPSVAPILDEQAGWDGVPLPKTDGSTAQYMEFQYADYVEMIYKNKFPYETFSEVSLEDYISRTMATARVFQFLGISDSQERARYSFTSFRHPTTAELAQVPKWNVEQKSTYRIEVFKFTGDKEPPTARRTTTQKVDKVGVFLSSASAVAHEDPKRPGTWKVKQFPKPCLTP